MKKFKLPGILLGLLLFLPLRSQAQPLDMPYLVYFDTVATTSLVISSTTFPSGVTSVNSNVASAQWCIDHVVVSAPASASTFTMAWSTAPFNGTLIATTTDYQVIVSTGIPYDAQWPYRDPYCAPIGQPVLTLKSTNPLSVMTVQGYLWKGWNP